MLLQPFYTWVVLFWQLTLRCAERWLVEQRRTISRNSSDALLTSLGERQQATNEKDLQRIRPAER